MNADLITMIGNLSQSLINVQYLLKGFGYFVGIALVTAGCIKFRKLAETRQGSESAYIPILYLLIGSSLLFMPSMVHSLANTVFGIGNILQYTQYNAFSVFNSMGILIKTIGFLWFIRGCFLILQPPQHQSKHTAKAIFYIFASILSINFENTAYYLSWLMEKISDLTLNSPGV